MTTDPVDDATLASVGLAARILLAYLDGDNAQVNQLLTADRGAADFALIVLAGTLAEHVWGEAVRSGLAELAITADLGDLGREVTG